MTFRLVGDDAIQAMQAMAENSVDAIVTDPPYGLEFMGRDWDRNMNHGPWATEALRILKPGGHLLAFGGTRTYHRLACAVEDAGFEIRDCIAWMYGSGFPKSLNIGDGMGTALKPAFEPIVLARKPLSERNVAANCQRWGTGALNIDGCRIDAPNGLTPGGAHTGASPNPMNRVGGVIEDRERAEEHPAGRWPANVTLDETAAEMLDEQTGDVGANGGTGQFVQHAWMGGDTPQQIDRDNVGGASRFFYCPKADREERNRGLGHMPAAIRDNAVSRADQDNEHARRPNRTPVGNHHPTVKPVELMRWLCRMVTPKGGTVLDPFTGSGSTGVAAMREGFEFIGIEREAEYVEIARARIVGDAPLFNVELAGGGPTE